MDCSLPAASAHGILQAGRLEWAAIAYHHHNYHIFTIITITSTTIVLIFTTFAASDSTVVFTK